MAKIKTFYRCLFGRPLLSWPGAALRFTSASGRARLSEQWAIRHLPLRARSSAGWGAISPFRPKTEEIYVFWVAIAV